MLALRLGHFNTFKGRNTLLLSGAASAISAFSSALASFAESSAQELEVHSLALVSERFPAKLIASKSSAATKRDAYCWACGHNEIPTILARLEAVVHESPSHAYFELVPASASAQLLVSSSEYPEAWWQQHG